MKTPRQRITMEHAKEVNEELGHYVMSLCAREGPQIIPALLLGTMEVLASLWISLEKNIDDTHMAMEWLDRVRQHTLLTLNDTRIIIASANPMVAAEMIGMVIQGSEAHLSALKDAGEPAPKRARRKS